MQALINMKERKEFLLFLSLSSDIEYVIDSIYTTILKAQIEANLSDIELCVISGTKLNKKNITLSQFI